MPNKECQIILISNITNVKLKTGFSHWIFEICHLKLDIPRPGGAGFTLIELLVAIAILAIVSAIGLTTYSKAQITARDSKRQQDLNSVNTALTIYYQAQVPHSYPSGNWGNLTTALAPPTYINQIPTDPGSFSYAYTSGGTCGGGACTYNLCARLENDNAVGNGIVASGTGCAGGSKYYYLTNP